MKRLLRTAAAGAAALLLLLASCGTPSHSRPSGPDLSDDQEAEPEQSEQQPEPLSLEEQERLMLRIDYALLCQGPYHSLLTQGDSVERALDGAWIGDGDGDGTEELFVQCVGPSGREILYTFDLQTAGTSLCYYAANQSATGSSVLVIDTVHGFPLLYSSFGSGAGEYHQYSRWTGDHWELWAGSSRVPDWDTAVDQENPAFEERAFFEGEELTLPEFNDRIDRLGLVPLPRDWADLFTAHWPDEDLHAFALLYTQHLLELNCDSILRADGDIDGDGEVELVWCLEGISTRWNQTMTYDEGFGAAPVEDQGLFSSGRGADLVIADPVPGGIQIRVGRLSHGAIQEAEFQAGLLCFTYNDQGAVIRFQYAGTDPESGQVILEEVIPEEHRYLRESVWYAYSPFDTFAHEYHFSEFGNGYYLHRLTGGTCEYRTSDSGGFRYTVSGDGRTVTITPTSTGPLAEAVYTYVPDSGYGPVLADLSDPAVEGSYQSKLWRYDAPPDTGLLLEEHLEKLPVAISGG